MRKISVSVRFVKREWGGPNPTWRRASVSGHYRDAVSFCIRKLTNKRAKAALFEGSSIKAY